MAVCPLSPRRIESQLHSTSVSWLNMSAAYWNEAGTRPSLTVPCLTLSREWKDVMLKGSSLHLAFFLLLLLFLLTSVCTKCQHWWDVLKINHSGYVSQIVPRWCWAGKVRLSYYKRREEFLMYSKVADTIWWHCGVVNCSDWQLTKKN